MRSHRYMSRARRGWPWLLGLVFSLIAQTAWAQPLDLALLRQLMPDAEVITPRDGDLPVWEARRGEQLLAYLFATDQIVDIPAYSGKPVNLLVAMAPTGKLLAIRVLEHHEPILLVGIPEQALFDFAGQYVGLSVSDRVRVGAGNQPGVHNVDAITGATVTVMVVNETIMRAATKVARALGIAGLQAGQAKAPAAVKMDLYAPASWTQLTGGGSIRRLHLTRGQLDEAFRGTRAEKVDLAAPEERDQTFIELYYGPLNVPTIGRNLLGDSQYQWLMGELQPGDQAIAVMGRGRYSFKGNGYVRGGIFDRIQLQQDNKTISFHDSDYYRLDDVYLDGFPGFREMAIFIVRDRYDFDPGRAWQLELLVRRQVGPLKSVFTRFSGDYQTPERYIDRPQPVPAEAREERPLWVSIWYESRFQIAVLGVALLGLTLILFLQDWLVRHPDRLRWIRLGYLAFTVGFIGWYALGQLSVVNVFTFTQALMGDFQWHTFLLDPMLFILWSFVAVSLLLWGRGVFCGWLCPFGALQELINEAARKLRIRQWELPFAAHERLWALKYIILLGLFAVSLDSLAQAERYAEVEPFKTAITLRFQREWGYVLYAGLLLVSSLFTRKVYCRYLCPLGAALAIPARLRLFDWLKRRAECGKPCQLCAKECEIQAIHPDGRINANECHYCLDCQMTYYNDHKCPPLVRIRLKKEKHQRKEQRIPTVDV